MLVLFNSLITILKDYGLPIGAILIIFCGLKYASSTDQQSASQAKSWAFRIAVGMIAVFASNVIMNKIQEVGNNVTLEEVKVDAKKE